MNVNERLTALFAAERRTRDLHRELLAAKPSELLNTLRNATKAASSLDAPEAALRLTRVAALLQGVEGPEAVDLLIDLLGSEHAEARLASGEALEAVAFDRFKEVALGVERSLDRLPVGHAALAELPYILGEVGEPGCVKLLGRFLKHKDGEAVGAAIEALVEMNDPSAIPMLEPLRADTRRVQLDDEDDEITLGELATDAIEILDESGE